VLDATGELEEGLGHPGSAAEGVLESSYTAAAHG
jgi:hypothetical protein